MPVNLKKGQRVVLDKGMTMALIGLGWDTNRYSGGLDFDLDASAFLLGENGKVLRDEDFIFYNNLEGRDGAIIHTGDNRTGEGEGDDEVVLIDFTKMPQEISRVAIVVTIHEAATRRQNFGQVSNAYVRVAKIDSKEDMVGEETIRFNLEEEFSIETSLLVCEIYRYNGDWKFNAVASGYQGGLEAFCHTYGVDV